MKRWTKGLESGQVMVILTVGIIALLGFTALAIDGGMVYSDRRYDQNTADNAALAGARAAGNGLFNKNISIDNFDCSNSDVLAAISSAYGTAQTSSAEFDVPIYHSASDYNNSKHGIHVVCSATAGGEKYLLIKVKITAETKPHFSQLIFGGKLENTVEAVTRVEPGVNNPTGPAAHGDGLVGLADNCDAEAIDLAADLSGNVKVTVLTGGIHSNSALGKDGAAGYIVTATGSEYRCVEGAPKKTEPFRKGTSYTDSVQTNPTHTDTLVTLEIDPPDCSALDVKTPSYNMTPGRYTNISLTANGAVLTMAPGLYCWDGTVKIDGGSVNVSGDPADGVTIFFSGTSFTLNGNGNTNLRAPLHSGRTAASGDAISGLLLYTPVSYTGELKINGTAGSDFRGTVFIPSGTLNIGGTSDTVGWAAQWLAKYVKFHGSPDFVLSYTADDLYWDDGHASPALVDVYQ